MKDEKGRSIKRKAIRCGRRWGKSLYGEVLAVESAVRGQYVGWFAPDYKIQSEAFNEMLDVMEPVVTSSNKNDGVIRTMLNGRIDFWSLENERAGRSRRYHLVVIDEAAFTKNNTMMDIWRLSIEPTLLDYNGDALAMSNANGNDPENFFYAICNDPSHGFTEYHAPTMANPLLPLRQRDETESEWLVRREETFDKLKREKHPLVFKQEYLAEFVDWSGVSFFSIERLLFDEQPVEYPRLCDTVFAVIDSAIKTGKTNDGTGVIYVAYQSREQKLIILDWDLIQIEGSMLEGWIPGVFLRCQELANQCNARHGSIGAFIEDKASGIVLAQQAARRQWPLRPIDSKLTSVGKVERAISVSGYVYSRKVLLSRYAFDKTSMYKGHNRNHLVSQVTGFRVDVKDQIDDDLLDTFCYAIALSLGNDKGF